MDFRQLSMATVTVARRVSIQWPDEAIDFFENIDDEENPALALRTLGNQARELARCFHVIAAWARDLCGRFHKAQNGTIMEAEDFKDAFREAETLAVKNERELQSKFEEAKNLREGVEATEAFVDSNLLCIVVVAYRTLGERDRKSCGSRKG